MAFSWTYILCIDDESKIKSILSIIQWYEGQLHASNSNSKNTSAAPIKIGVCLSYQAFLELISFKEADKISLRVLNPRFLISAEV